MASGGAPRDSIGEAITADRPVGVRSPKPHASVRFQNKSHSRSHTESQGLLPSPTIQFGYDSRTSYRFPSTPTIYAPTKEKKKPAHAPRWASVPSSLGERGKARLKAVAVDGFLTAISIPFFVLAGVIIQLDGTRIDGYQQNALEQCIKCVSLIRSTNLNRSR